MAKDRQIALSGRLRAIAALVPPGSRAADIGTDHGYLPVWLLQNQRVSFMAACDVNHAPLEHARQSAAQYGLEDAVAFRLGDGLSRIAPEEVDTIIIAGMGGETIAAILDAAPWTKEPRRYRLLLQPMTKQPFLRTWLAEHGYQFLEERLVYENHTYFPVMMVTGGGTGEALSPGAQWGGVLLGGDVLQGFALAETIRHLAAAAEGLERSAGQESQEKAAYYHMVIDALERMKEEWEHDNGQAN